MLVEVKILDSDTIYWINADTIIHSTEKDPENKMYEIIIISGTMTYSFFTNTCINKEAIIGNTLSIEAGIMDIDNIHNILYGISDDIDEIKECILNKTEFKESE